MMFAMEIRKAESRRMKMHKADMRTDMFKMILRGISEGAKGDTLIREVLKVMIVLEDTELTQSAALCSSVYMLL